MVNQARYLEIREELKKNDAVLVAVSKTKPVADIRALYELGQRDFGENYVQELLGKQQELPSDIHWHFIGHLQSNKVKYIIPFVHLIHGVDSLKLLLEINKQAGKQGRVVDVLIQVHIAQEETKFGFDETELQQLFQPGKLTELSHIKIRGLMGMASNTEDKTQVIKEFKRLKSLFDTCKSNVPGNDFTYLSMGMSSDYQEALAEGSNMVRIGSLIFGERNYN